MALLSLLDELDDTLLSEKFMMTKKHPAPSDETWVLSSLEHDQLAKARKHLIPRRSLKGVKLAVIWALRIYLLFMMAVVAYQVWIAAR